MNSLFRDLHYAARTLRKRPQFAATAILTLALGIGATTAIFSVVDTLMLRPLPYTDAERVVTIWQNNSRDGNPRDDVAPANFYDWRERSTAFSAMAAADPFAYSMLDPDGRPETVFAVRVTEGFFDALGARAHRGWLFAPEHHRPGAGRYAVLTHGFWQRRLGGDPMIVGSTLSLAEEPFVVLGVLPPEFEPGLLGEIPGERGVWVARQEEGWERQARSSSGWWNVIARLAPGVSLDEARADMDRVAGGLATEHADTNAGVGATVVPLADHLVSHARTVLLVLMGAVGFVLLIACANVANLLVVRATDQERDLAVRLALGADRRRLTRLLLTESLLLGLLGAAAGVAIAIGGVHLIQTIAPAEVPRIDTVHVDLRVLGFALAVSLFTPLAFGLVPAIQAARSDLLGAISGTRTTLRKERMRLRAGLIVGEIALALTLLIGAGLLVRSLAAILHVDPGFRRENVLALQVFAWDQNPTFEERVRFFDETLRRIEALPGVTSAGAVGAGPFLGTDLARHRTLSIEGQPAGRASEEAQVVVNQATAGYFRTLGIPLLRGRMFDASDGRDTPRVAVVNETLRRRFWSDTDPLGTRVLLGEDGPPAEIIGIVGDVRSRNLDVPARPEIYLAHTQTGFGEMTYFVATRGDAVTLTDAVKREIWAVEPLQDFYQVATLEALISQTLMARRFSLVLLGLFAGLALVMAAVGTYGVISFSVSRRIHELGVRMALGANRADVLQLVLRHGLGLTLGGIVLGLAGALALTRLLATLLYEVAPWDGWTFAAAASLLAGVALLASYIPARRATRVEPVEALRNE